MFDPTNCETWTYIGNHPIFTKKSNIQTWSHFPDEYRNLDHYTSFDPDMYCGDYFESELDQRAIVARDVGLLADGCRKITQEFPGTKYEIIVTDDCTISARVVDEAFKITILPSLPIEEPYFLMMTDSTRAYEENRCADSSSLVNEIKALLSV